MQSFKSWTLSFTTSSVAWNMDVFCYNMSLSLMGLFLFTLLHCRVFVGTVSAFCVKHAECPVMTIKRNADETPSDPADD